MPLLDDAKNCFVGQTQIKQIYAGTQLVWPKDSGSSKIVKATFSGQQNYCFRFAEPDGFPCPDMQSVYQYRIKLAGANWSNWNIFNGWKTAEDGGTAYLYITRQTGLAFDNAEFEFRKNGIVVEQFTITDLINSPDFGSPAFTLYCDANP
jgi:hypothetical protein